MFFKFFTTKKVKNVHKTIDQKAADNIRILSAAMVEKANSGHPGGAMGGADFIHILYSEFLRFDPDHLDWRFRDRFFLDPGHMSAMLYSQLVLIGGMQIEDIKAFRQWKSVTPGHPEVDRKRGIENTSGPLGLGHAFGVGSAIGEAFMAEKFGDWMGHNTYLYISDGGIQEEISQGVGRIAGYLGLGKVIMFYDANEVQLSTMVDEVTSENTAAKYEAWGWHVLTIDGNDHNAIRAALQESKAENSKPSLIIGETVMGLGAVKADGSPYEGQVETHGKPLGSSAASYEETIINLGGDPEDAFQVFPDVQAYYEMLLDKKRAEAAAINEVFEEWKADHPTQAAKLEDFYSNRLPAIDWSSISVKSNDATRNASSMVLGHLAEHVENMIVSSADLSNSDKTDGFLKKRSAITKNNFKVGFLHAGVSELTMGALSTGMALHGGIIPVCATFFAFSDYMKPVLRVSALMEQPVIFLYTHDAFRVGEDGPTHQPIEQEAQIRLLEKLHNHNGQPSLIALRPADGSETIAAWQYALTDFSRPTALILSRQNVNDLNPSTGGGQLQKGAYVVQENSEAQLTLIANGSEVSTLQGAMPILAENGIKTRLVSVPSEGLFRSQSASYQNEVLKNDLPIFGLTAGLPVTLQGFVSDPNMIHGLSHFGYSAPYQVLDEEFGFTPKQVASLIIKLLGQ